MLYTDERVPGLAPLEFVNCGVMVYTISHRLIDYINPVCFVIVPYKEQEMSFTTMKCIYNVTDFSIYI